METKHRPKRVSQMAIANQLGISRATVSLVLRGGSGPSRQTKRLVLDAAKAMGYRSNALIQSIKSGWSKTVGVMVQPYDSHWSQVLYGIHDRLIEDDCIPLMLWNYERHGIRSEEYALAQIHRMLDRWVDGVILWPHFAQLFARHLQEFSSRNLPIVTIDHILRGPVTADAVLSDEALIARLLATHLTEYGHQRILMLCGMPGLAWADRRVEETRTAVQAYGRSMHFEVRRIESDAAAVEAEVGQALARPRRPTAVIAGADHMALGIYAAARKLHLRIPEDLSVIGVADLQENRGLWPPLTSIFQDGYEQGKKAAEMIMMRNRGALKSRRPLIAQLPVTLNVRASTGPAPRG